VKLGLSLDGFARIWDVNADTLYTWVKAYKQRGPKGLEHPCGEGRRGRKPLAAPLREEIVLVQRRFPDFGLRKVRDFLARFRGLKVSTSGVRSAIVAAGVPRAQAPKRRGRGRDLVRRFERSRPGELWQSDITSYVLARQSRRVHLIVYLDDFSRYVVSWSLHLTMTAAIAGETLLEGVARFGKPKELLTDQGPQYFAWRGKCGFQKLLEREGIEHVVARTHHPQTLGKCERLWETVGRELWDRAHPQDLAEARTRLAHFIRHYNHFRPHQGIGGLVPADRFFGAQDAVRKAVEAAMTENELRLALGERPRKSVFLFGQIGDEQVSLHGERGRLVVQTPEGSQEMDLQDMGIEQEARDDEDADGGGGGDADGGDDGNGDDAGARGRDADTQGSGASSARELPAAGLPDPGAVGGGERGGASTGACAVCDAARVLAGSGEQAGGGAPSRGAADPRVADEPARGGGDGVRTLEAAERQERQARDGTGRGRPRSEEGERAPGEGERAAAGPGVGLARDAGQQGPGDSGAVGGDAEGGRGDEAPEEEKQTRAPVCARCCGSGLAADPLSTGNSGSSRSSSA
jgi:transposase InsO family protein